MHACIHTCIYTYAALEPVEGGDWDTDLAAEIQVALSQGGLMYVYGHVCMYAVCMCVCI